LHAAASCEGARRRRGAALTGFDGDEHGAIEYLADVDPGVRATALGALARMGKAGHDVIARVLADPSPVVRRRYAELATSLEGADYLPLLSDPDPGVVEAACFAVGEVRDARAVSSLSQIATGHDDALCRESAVAALGAIGDPAGLPAILVALADRPPVRRRAVIALAPFEGAEVDAALEKALADRDWQVRQAAEDQLRP
jgi:HEAT repeat protein